MRSLGANNHNTMQRLFFFLGVVAFAACGDVTPPTVEEIIQAKIEEATLPNFNDPGSYEFVSLTKGGSTTIADNIDYRRRDAKDDLVDARADLKRYQDSEKLLGAGASADYIARANRSIARATAEQTALDSLSKMFVANGTLNDTVSVTWIWKYRAKNALGALVIGEQMVQIGAAPDYEIQKMTDETKKLFLTPGGIPGWQETMAGILEKYPF